METNQEDKMTPESFEKIKNSIIKLSAAEINSNMTKVQIFFFYKNQDNRYFKIYIISNKNGKDIEKMKYITYDKILEKCNGYNIEKEVDILFYSHSLNYDNITSFYLIDDTIFRYTTITKDIVYYKEPKLYKESNVYEVFDLMKQCHAETLWKETNTKIRIKYTTIFDPKPNRPRTFYYNNELNYSFEEFFPENISFINSMTTACLNTNIDYKSYEVFNVNDKDIKISNFKNMFNVITFI